MSTLKNNAWVQSDNNTDIFLQKHEDGRIHIELQGLFEDSVLIPCPDQLLLAIYLEESLNISSTEAKMKLLNKSWRSIREVKAFYE